MVRGGSGARQLTVQPGSPSTRWDDQHVAPVGRPPSPHALPLRAGAPFSDLAAIVPQIPVPSLPLIMLRPYHSADRPTVLTGPRHAAPTLALPGPPCRTPEGANPRCCSTRRPPAATVRAALRHVPPPPPFSDTARRAPCTGPSVRCDAWSRARRDACTHLPPCTLLPPAAAGPHPVPPRPAPGYACLPPGRTCHRSCA